MENVLIDNNLNSKYYPKQITKLNNYQQIRLMMKSLRDRDITKKEDYIQWLKEWKAFRKEMVEAIQYHRSVKNVMKATKQTYEYGSVASFAWTQKIYLRVFAMELEKMRRDNKEFVKALLTKQTEAA